MITDPLFSMFSDAEAGMITDPLFAMFSDAEARMITDPLFAMFSDAKAGMITDPLFSMIFYLYNSNTCSLMIYTFNIMYMAWCLTLHHNPIYCWALSIYNYFNLIPVPLYHNHTLLPYKVGMIPVPLPSAAGRQRVLSLIASDLLAPCYTVNLYHTVM